MTQRIPFAPLLLSPLLLLYQQPIFSRLRSVLLCCDDTSVREYSSSGLPCPANSAGQLCHIAPLLMKVSKCYLRLLQGRQKPRSPSHAWPLLLFFNLAPSRLIIIAVCHLKMTVLSKSRPLAVVSPWSQPCFSVKRRRHQSEFTFVFKAAYTVSDSDSYCVYERARHCPSSISLCPIHKTFMERVSCLYRNSTVVYTLS